MSSENPPPGHPDNSLEPDSDKKKKEEKETHFRSYVPEPKRAPAYYDSLIQYLKENPRDALAYILMVIALLMILFGSYLGYANLIVGLIVGLYFADELAFLANNIKEFIEEYDLVKALMLGGALLTLCIQVPLFFVGVAIIMIIRILWPETKTDS